jgi:CheY-like chemotaxis protein
MPEMDGFQTARQVREQEHRLAATGCSQRRVPIVALTTVSQPGTRERCLETGMDEHLTKPVNTARLYETISRILNLPVDGS